jgi:hypothetical protein
MLTIYPSPKGFQVSRDCRDVWLSVGKYGWDAGKVGRKELERGVWKFLVTRRTFYTMGMQKLSSCSKSIKSSKVIERMLARLVCHFFELSVPLTGTIFFQLENQVMSRT